MIDLKTSEIENVIKEINEDRGEFIPNYLLKKLVEGLDGAEVLCPVENDEISLLKWGYNTFIPVFFNEKDLKKFFKDASAEIFNFNRLEDFITRDVNGIYINPHDFGIIFNRTLCDLVFNRQRPRKPTVKGYDVKVRLNDFRPLTWRDLIIPDNITFMELDDVLKTLWNFNGHHLSCFLIKKDGLIITDEDLSAETMMDCDFEANTTLVSEIFDKYDKVTYWYDFGDDWQFDIEVKKKIDYDRDYVTIKRFKGKYSPIEDCEGVYGLSEIVYYAEHPEEADSSYFAELVEYLDEFDMEFTQMLLENKAYFNE